MRHAARKDGNHNEIEAAFRQMLGDHVTDLSAAGDGVGDLFVSFGGEFTEPIGYFVEIKRDEKAEYTAAQIRFRKQHPGCTKRIETVDQAIAFAQFIRARVKLLAGLTEVTA